MLLLFVLNQTDQRTLIVFKQFLIILFVEKFKMFKTIDEVIKLNRKIQPETSARRTERRFDLPIQLKAK